MRSSRSSYCDLPANACLSAERRAPEARVALYLVIASDRSERGNLIKLGWCVGDYFVTYVPRNDYWVKLFKRQKIKDKDLKLITDWCEKRKRENCDKCERREKCKFGLGRKNEK